MSEITYKFGDALDATEELLLVPVARRAINATDGFARQVFEALPETQRILKQVNGLYLGQTLEIGKGFAHNWTKPYTAVLAAMHRRDEMGWEDAPYILTGVLAHIHERHEGKRLAVAGTPGAGYSGLLGDAKSFDIMRSLIQTKVPIVVYRHREIDDPEPRELVAPLPSDHIAVEESSITQVGSYLNA
jgi:hypothetical protein